MRSWDAKDATESDADARARLGLATGRRVPRRTLTARGRVTIASLAAVVGVVGLLALPGYRGGDRGADETATWRARIDAAFSSWAGEEPGAAASVAVDAPAFVLERLPSSRDALELARTNAPLPGGALPVSLRSENGLDPSTSARFVDWVAVPAVETETETETGSGMETGSPRETRAAALAGPLRIEYALDAELTERVFRVLSRARTKRGHVVVLDARSGRVMSYASTDRGALPPERAYPAASLAKVVTAAAALDLVPRAAKRPCLYRGSPYRLTRARVHPTRGGNEASLEKAIAGSYNQCFAQLAVHALGDERLMMGFRRFGWLESPAPGHDSGMIDRGEGDYELGKLGSGLAGSRITVLHAAQLAASLASGDLLEPWWIDRVVDATGRSLTLPARGVRRRVMRPAVARELRGMLVRTTTRGTARRAFRTRRGVPRLDDVRVAGKTGNLSGRDPKGRYEWFAGIAPADDPRIAVAVLQVHDHLWWRSSAQIAGDVFSEIFCERSRCRSQLAARFTGDLVTSNAPVFLTESTR